MGAYDQPLPLSRGNVRMLHGVYCYRDRSDHRWSYDDYDRWGGTCICHHAVWHSFPDRAKGARMFEAMTPEFAGLGSAEVVDGEVVPAAREITPVRRALLRGTF